MHVLWPDNLYVDGCEMAGRKQSAFPQLCTLTAGLYVCVFYHLKSIQSAITDTFQFSDPDNAKGHIPDFNTSAPFLMISWSHQGITII